MYRLDIFQYPAELMERLDRDAAEPMRALQERQSPSIFPKFDALMTLGAYQDALGFIAEGASLTNYRSYSDFVFCELFPEYAEACQAYYESGGEQLKETWSAEEARRCELVMLCLLGLAIIIREDNPGDGDKCPVSWQAILESAREIISYAPRSPAPLPQ